MALLTRALIFVIKTGLPNLEPHKKRDAKITTKDKIQFLQILWNICAAVPLGYKHN
jgi:hypothetical protein